VAAVMVPFIIYGAFLMVLTSGLPMVQEWVVKLLNEGVMALNGLAGWTSALPYATFSFSIFRPIEVMVFYAMMGVWVMYWKNRKRSWLIGGLAMSACLLGIHFCLLLVNHFYK
jgi:hypothetical protein